MAKSSWWLKRIWTDKSPTKKEEKQNDEQETIKPVPIEPGSAAIISFQNTGTTASVTPPPFPAVDAMVHNRNWEYAAAAEVPTKEADASAAEQRTEEESPDWPEYRREFPGIPGLLSVTVRQSSTSSRSFKFLWQLDLVKDEKTQDVVIVGFLPESSLIHFNFFLEGDVLKEVNFCECRNLTVQDIQELLDQSGGGLITLSATRPTGDPTQVQATAITLHGSVPIMDVEETEMITGLEFERSTTDRELCKVSQKSVEGYLGQSVLEPGDEVLWMNGIDCFDTTPQDLMLLLNAKFMGADYICIQARRKPKWSVRRAAVAAAGGSMVSVGAAIMATPLHPVGHALAIGGVGVLSTEFEGPRRAVESAKQRLQFKSNTSNKTSDDKTTDSSTAMTDGDGNQTQGDKVDMDSSDNISNKSSSPTAGQPKEIIEQNKAYRTVDVDDSSESFGDMEDVVVTEISATSGQATNAYRNAESFGSMEDVAMTDIPVSSEKESSS
ncbi:hypothetical protein ACA910_007273 [Epithemia clementina (nom. ined.)]